MKTDAFTIVVLVARVWRRTIAFARRVHRNAFACAAVALFAIGTVFVAIAIDATSKRTVWIVRVNFIVSTIAITAAFIRTDAFTICLHIASVHFATVPLENVTEYKYLGRPLSADDSDNAAVSLNISKATRTWFGMYRILSSDGADSKTFLYLISEIA
jgi:hypothetical protein